MILVTFSDFRQTINYKPVISFDVTVTDPNSVLVASLASIRAENVNNATGAKFNGVNMTPINTQASFNNAGTKQWYMYNPPVGTYTLQVNSSNFDIMGLSAVVFVGDNLDSTPYRNGTEHRYDNKVSKAFTNPTSEPSFAVSILNTQNQRPNLRPGSGQTSRGLLTQTGWGHAAVATTLSSAPTTPVSFFWDTLDSASYSTVIFKDNPAIVPPTADGLTVVSSTSNTIGEGTDVQLGYRVKADLYYGATDVLVDDTGDVYNVYDGEAHEWSVSTGAPSGITIFDGYINSYNMTIGERNLVDVEMISWGAELANKVITNGTSTTVAYNSFDPSNIVRDIIDKQAGRVTYDASTTPLTGTTTSYTFRVNTSLEGLDKALELAPADWYYTINPGSNLLTFNTKATTPHHTLTLGKHIKEINVGATLSRLVNSVYFVGGDSGSGTVYRKYDDSASINTYGEKLEIITDGRVTTSGTADLISENKIANFKDPKDKTTVSLSIGHYDIHSIEIGQMIAFSNSGFYLDNLLLQVVDLRRTPTTLTMTLDLPSEPVNKRVEDILRNQNDLYTVDVPSSPS